MKVLVIIGYPLVLRVVNRLAVPRKLQWVFTFYAAACIAAGRVPHVAGCCRKSCFNPTIAAQ